MWQQELVKSIQAERPIRPELIPVSVASRYFSTTSWMGCYNLGQHKKKQQSNFPRGHNEGAKEQTLAILASMKWGEGWPRYSIYFVQDCNLNRTKRNKPPSPHQNNGEGANEQKFSILGSLKWGKGWPRCSLCFVLGQNEKERINPIPPSTKTMIEARRSKNSQF